MNKIETPQLTESSQVTKGDDKMTLDHGTDFISIEFSGEDKKAAIRLIRKWLEIIEKST